MTFYFLTFATAAWGYVVPNTCIGNRVLGLTVLSYSYSLLAWLAEILRKEPEARSLLVGASVTLVCKLSSNTLQMVHTHLILTRCRACDYTSPRMADRR